MRVAFIDASRMELADLTRVAEQHPALGFLVIGGYAVAAHGHTRATFDVDFEVLPDAPGFRALTSRVSLAKMIRRSRQLREWFPAGVPSAQECWRAKTTEAFKLQPLALTSQNAP